MIMLFIPGGRGGANPTPSRSPSSRSKCAPTATASLQQGQPQWRNPTTKANATAMRIRESETPHGEAQRRRATITIGTLRQRQPNGETQRRRATITHWIAAPAAAQRRNSTPKAKTAGSSTRQARAPAQSASRAYSKGCALPRPPRLARDGLFAFAQNAKAPRDRGVGGR